MENIGVLCFALALVHVFSAPLIKAQSYRFKPGSVTENLYHFLGETEVVFGLWSAVLIVIWTLLEGKEAPLAYIESLNFTEALFVFVVMVIASTKPITEASSKFIQGLTGLIPIEKSMATFVLVMALGPLLGSLITEPAAMAVTALLVEKFFFRSQTLEAKFRYAILGLLFVNISIGGALTDFAAPPILMVAKTWGWDLALVFKLFGPRALLAVVLNTALAAFILRKALKKSFAKETKKSDPLAIWVVIVHLGFLAGTVLLSHYPRLFIPLFLFFLGFCEATNEYQRPLALKSSLLVAFFLAGLVCLGNLQAHWLKPLISAASPGQLYWGSMALTAITDNAALTYLGSLVPGLSPDHQYRLVAGAIVGGGMTLIANAPNPVGAGILGPYFGKKGIEPLKLALAALPPTVIAALSFWLI